MNHRRPVLLSVLLLLFAIAMPACTSNRGGARPSLPIAKESPAPEQKVAPGSGPHAANVRKESRGIWLTLGELLLEDKNAPEGAPVPTEAQIKQSLETRLDRLKAAGFNTVYVNVQMRGYVIYEFSTIMPQLPLAKERFPKLLEWLVPQIKARGLRVEAWPEYGFLSFWSKDLPQGTRGHVLDKMPELAAHTHDGKDHYVNKFGHYYGLCPANPKSQDLMIDFYNEVMSRYAFDGLNLDRVRFGDDSFCHCSYCKEHFKEDTGIELRKFPKDSSEQQTFSRWRKKQLVGFMSRLSERLRRAHPEKPITSAVVAPGMIEEKGQDWPEWLSRGYVDAVMPMLYTTDLPPELRAIDRLVPKGAQVYYGLDAANGGALLKKQIKQARDYGAPGLTIWYGISADKVLDELGQSFAEPAESPIYP